MEPRTPRLYHGGEGSALPATFTALGAVGVVSAAMATMLVGAVLATAAGAPVMVVGAIAQVLMLAVAIGAMRGSGRPAAAIGWRRPVSNRFFAAALLIGASAWYLNLRLVDVLPLRHADTRLEELIDRPSTAVVILAVGLAPAIAEEVVFRGVLVRALAVRFVLPVALVAGALVFSLYHLRVVQLVPTFTLGLVLGYLAIRADSAVPGMLAHFTNNTIALVIARDDVPALADAFVDHPNVALAGCAVATAAGLVIATGWRRREGEP